jgi:hypothetical protein
VCAIFLINLLFIFDGGLCVGNLISFFGASGGRKQQNMRTQWSIAQSVSRSAQIIQGNNVLIQLPFDAQDAAVENMLPDSIGQSDQETGWQQNQGKR